MSKKIIAMELHMELLYEKGRQMSGRGRHMDCERNVLEPRHHDTDASRRIGVLRVGRWLRSEFHVVWEPVDDQHCDNNRKLFQTSWKRSPYEPIILEQTKN